MLYYDFIFYFMTEYIYFLVLCFTFFLLSQIRDKYFFYMFFLLGIPLTFSLITNYFIFIFLSFIVVGLLRWNLWSNNIYQKKWESICWLVSTFIHLVAISASYCVQEWLLSFFSDSVILEIMYIVNGSIFSILLTFCARALLVHIRSCKEGISTFTLQVGFLLTTLFISIEITQHFGLSLKNQLLFIVFLILYSLFSLFQTMKLLKRNRDYLESERLKKSLDLMQAYTHEIEIHYLEFRKFKHDYKNLLLGLQKQIEKTDENYHYLEEMLYYSDEVLNQSVMRFYDLTNIASPVLKTFIIAKLSFCEQKQIKIKFECMDKLDIFLLEEVKLIRILGIMMDNAIEAAINSSKKEIHFYILNRSQEVEFLIENSFSGNLPKLSDIQKCGFSTKGKNRGLGLFIIQDILACTSHTEVIYGSINGFFVSSLIIRKEIKK